MLVERCRRRVSCVGYGATTPLDQPARQVTCIPESWVSPRGGQVAHGSCWLALLAGFSRRDCLLIQITASRLLKSLS